MVSLGIITSIY